ncbi:MAG: polyamine aminopropyltransferase [Deltaproteobacteria bacterium]|nr:MAG: polyamine aminopropyltransferase [Deltaproteobacteria bacterium]
MSPYVFRYEISPHISVHLECSGILHSSQSRFQKIEVVESLDFGKMLVLDGVINLTERDEFVYHEMLVHVPLFSHPKPLKILIVGGGDGGTAREVLKHEGITRVQLVEIDGEVIAVSKKFFPSLGLALGHPKLNVLLVDAIQYVREIEEKFDIILIDSTDPVIEQSEGLFTGAFYGDCLKALTEQGILAAQVGDIFFETDLVLSIFTRLREVFPIVRIYLAPIPSYTLVPYSFAFCSKTIHPEMGLGLSRFDRGLETRYYNPQIHHAAFALPEHLREEFER